MNNKEDKIIVILGPTSSGKTKLGVKLAGEFNGEIVSADSRQVYKYMDVGTGKDLAEYTIGKKKKINHHLIDVIHPKNNFSLSEYKKQVKEAIKKIKEKGKLPIIVGGTGLYLQAIVDNYNLTSVKPDYKLREQLEKKETEEVFKELEKYNSKFAHKLNNSEKNNKRHLIRYVEIAREGKLQQINKSKNSNNFLLLGLDLPTGILDRKIYKRLVERLEKEDMIEEVKDLHKNKGLTYKRLKSFGLEYKYLSRYLQKELSYQEMVNKLFIAIRRFAKRQKTWFRRWERQGKKINWVEDYDQAKEKIKKFLEKK